MSRFFMIFLLLLHMVRDMMKREMKLKMLLKAKLQYFHVEKKEKFEKQFSQK